MADRKKVTPSELPPEILLFHILPKLPAKSLLRFKCVCKQWRSFLTTPTFAKIHLHHVTTVDRHEKLIFWHRSLRYFQTIDCEDGLIVTPPRCYPFQGMDAIITASVNGLVCVGIRKIAHQFSDIILWNPLTGEYKTLSKPIDKKCYNRKSMDVFELYYTCSDDDYKILSITYDRNVYIYSLKSDSWRKLESTLDDQDCIPDVRDHNLLDEKLHFFVPNRVRNRKITKNVIIRLDLKTERFTKIVFPSTRLCGCMNLMVVRGCIQLTICKVAYSSRGPLIIETWQIDGDGDWTKVVNSSLSFDNKNWSFLEPVYLMRDGNWLLHTRDGICKVDPEKETIDDLFSNCKIYFHGRPIYIETFVSPNQYIN